MTEHCTANISIHGRSFFINHTGSAILEYYHVYEVVAEAYFVKVGIFQLIGVIIYYHFWQHRIEIQYHAAMIFVTFPIIKI